LTVFSNISFRYKVPFSLAAAILLTAAAVSGWLTVQDFQDNREAVREQAARLGATLAHSIRHTLVHDDVWQTYQIIRSPGMVKPNHADDEELLVLDVTNRVYCSSNPRRFPVQSSLAADDARYGPLWRYLVQSWQGDVSFRDDLVPGRLVLLVPVISEAGGRVGTLILSHPVQTLAQRLYDSAMHVLLPTALLMAIMLPAGWLWGRQLAAPIRHLAGIVERVGRDPAVDIDIPKVTQRDEVGLLAERCGDMIQQLRVKEALEKQLLTSERLSAIGQVSSGIAHEINNPLGGMLNAIDTHLRFRSPDAATKKTLAFLQRGLHQIQAAMTALLMEVRADSHDLSPDDLEDIRFLVSHQAEDKGVSLAWCTDLPGPLSLPAVPIRQIMLNLLLNAIKAAPSGSAINSRVALLPDTLAITVANCGEPIPQDCLDRLFGGKELQQEQSGRLGLWVVGQLTRRLKGEIVVESVPGNTTFTVIIPLPASDSGHADALHKPSGRAMNFGRRHTTESDEET
jgi:two-component system NtrC family sensor kinase